MVKGGEFIRNRNKIPNNKIERNIYVSTYIPGTRKSNISIWRHGNIPIY